MPAQTGRTVPHFCKFQIEDSGGALRDIGVRSFGDVGLTYDEIDVSVFQELVKQFLANQATFSLTVTAAFDNTAAQTASVSGESAASKLTGALTAVEPLNGGLTPRAFAVYFGMRQDWVAGEPVFGADNCVGVSDFKAQPDAGTCTFKLYHIAGGTAPAWGTAAITVA